MWLVLGEQGEVQGSSRYFFNEINFTKSKGLQVLPLFVGQTRGRMTEINSEYKIVRYKWHPIRMRRRDGWVNVIELCCSMQELPCQEIPLRTDHTCVAAGWEELKRNPTVDCLIHYEALGLVAWCEGDLVHPKIARLLAYFIIPHASGVGPNPTFRRSERDLVLFRFIESKTKKYITAQAKVSTMNAQSSSSKSSEKHILDIIQYVVDKKRNDTSFGCDLALEMIKNIVSCEKC